MIDVRLLLLDGSILTAVFAAFVVGSMLWKPRMWLHDFPADIQARVPPKTEEERRLTKRFAVPFFVVLLAGFAIPGLRYGAANGFWGLALHLYLIRQMITPCALVVLDWGGMHLIDPRRPPLAGTEGAKGYRDYGFHFVGFLKGSVMGVALALAVAVPVWFLA